MQIHQIVPLQGAASQRALAGELRPLFRSIDPSSDIYYTLVDHNPAAMFLDSIVVVHAGALEDPMVDLIAANAQHLIVIGGESVHLSRLTERCALAVGHSADQSQLLWSMGFRSVATCEPIVNIEPIVAAIPHGPTMHHFERHVDGPLVLVLGGVDPLERAELQVQSYYVLLSHLRNDVHMAWIGEAESARYHECIEHEINELNLDLGWIAGKLDCAEIAAYLRHASVVLTTRADHTDFASALLAMRLGIPVVATEAPGAKELFGDGALLLPADAGPQLIAEALNVVLSDDAVRADLVQRGTARAAEYNVDVARANLLTAILEAV